MVKCDSCIFYMLRIDGRKVKCRQFKDAQDQHYNCLKYKEKNKKVDLLKWTGVR